MYMKLKGLYAACLLATSLSLVACSDNKGETENPDLGGTRESETSEYGILQTEEPESESTDSDYTEESDIQDEENPADSKETEDPYQDGSYTGQISFSTSAKDFTITATDGRTVTVKDCNADDGKGIIVRNFGNTRGVFADPSYEYLIAGLEDGESYLLEYDGEISMSMLCRNTEKGFYVSYDADGAGTIEITADASVRIQNDGFIQEMGITKNDFLPEYSNWYNISVGTDNDNLYVCPNDKGTGYHVVSEGESSIEIGISGSLDQTAFDPVDSGTVDVLVEGDGGAGLYRNNEKESEMNIGCLVMFAIGPYNNSDAGILNSISVQRGEKATLSVPQIDGLTFAGWYTDSECTEKFNDDTEIWQDTQLYAKWE